MSKFSPLSQSALLEYFSYDPHTGVLTRIKKTSGRRGGIGETVGSPCGQGYLQMRFFRKTLVHRVIWVMVYGVDISNLEIDHINGIKTDNRLSNLRSATHSENVANKHGRPKTVTGFWGVTCRGDSFAARISMNNKTIFLGSYKNRYDAALAYDAAAIEYHGEFATLNFPIEGMSEAAE